MTIKPSQTIQPINRRTLRKSFGLAFVPKVQNISPIPRVPKPKFWFGDRVSYCWFDDDDQQLKRSENGNIIGVCWHPLDKCWQYLVIWLDSTIDEKWQPEYPIFDERLLNETELQRHYLEAELCKQY